MTVRSCLLVMLLLSTLPVGCRRPSQGWSKSNHARPMIEIQLIWQENGPYSYPRGTSTHILQLEDTIKNVSLDVKDLYLMDDGNSTFTISRCKGHVVATYYGEELYVEHRLALELVRTPRGCAVRRAVYFLHGHEPPEPAWDWECDPPREIKYCDEGMVPSSALTLEFNVKSLAGFSPLTMKIMFPPQAIPLCMR